MANGWQIASVVFTSISAGAAAVAAWQARQAARAEYRPKLRVGLITSGNRHDTAHLRPGKPLRVRVGAVNRGGRRLRVIASHCGLHIGTGLPMHRPYTDDDCNNFFPRKRMRVGQSRAGKWKSQEGLTIAQLDDIQNGRAKLYVLGFIRYTDAEHHPRRTMFCREYSPTRDRFLPVDDPDYSVEN
jgi:hypothetical protein